MTHAAPAAPTQDAAAAPSAAPGAGGDLVLVEQFLNTLDERTFSRHGQQHVPVDHLTSPAALGAWLQAHGLLATAEVLGPAELDAARSLRAGLRAALEPGTSAGADPGPDADLDVRAGGARVLPALAAFPLHLAPDASGRLHLAADSGVAGLDAVLEAVTVGVAAGRWGRLKLCAAPDCRWAFFDTSRSGGGRWCSMQICGNRHKTRTYRQRRVD